MHVDERRQPQLTDAQHSSGAIGSLLAGEEDVGEHGLGLERCLQNRQTLSSMSNVN